MRISTSMIVYKAGGKIYDVAKIMMKKIMSINVFVGSRLEVYNVRKRFLVCRLEDIPWLAV